MLLKSRILPAGALALLASAASAHTGHDHSHWMSSPIHLLTALAISSTIVVALWYAKSKSPKQAESSITEKD